MEKKHLLIQNPPPGAPHGLRLFLDGIHYTRFMPYMRELLFWGADKAETTTFSFYPI